jgi:hypothetical protein
MNVTMIEFPAGTSLGSHIEDIGYPANLSPHIGSGLGGSTQYWHNGLIEIEDSVFKSKWPYSKLTLESYYEQAYKKLSNISRARVKDVFSTLRSKFLDQGVSPSLLRQLLFYPSLRRNVWDSLHLQDRVKLVRAEVVGFIVDSDSRIEALEIMVDGQKALIKANIYVMAAGGLGTPILLQELAKQITSPSLKMAGHYYEDHPTGFVAEVKTVRPFYKLWNYKSSNIYGSFRIPMVLEEGGLQVSFQLRPAYQAKTGIVYKCILNDLRNSPFKLTNYLKLIFYLDDFVEIISFKLGINLPTKKFSVLMVAEQLASAEKSIWRNSQTRKIARKWELSTEYLQLLERTINKFFHSMGSVMSHQRILLEWKNYLSSSAHHSGTARMHLDPNLGVCDSDGRVYGVDNLYICDGSAIPASGAANTGLTIGALAIKLGDHLLHSEPNFKKAS